MKIENKDTNPLNDQLIEEYKRKFSILLVDDIQDNITTLRLRLERTGFSNFHIANDGKEALDIITSETVNLMLLDIMMPNMDGMTLLKHIQKELINNKLMVLMISAADTQENVIECIKMGADDFLQKPFNKELLHARVNSCFEKYMYKDIEQNTREKIESERMRYEKLLYAIFPPKIVEEYVQYNQVMPRQFENVAVLFIDVAKFTHYSAGHDSTQILFNLQEISDICEMAALKYGLEKIKTVGDAFLATGNMLTKDEKAVESCIACAKEIIVSCNRLPAHWGMRAGIDFGTILAGIIGRRRFLYDIFGNAVNTASRLQALAEVNSIFLSKAARDTLSKEITGLERLQPQTVKGRGTIDLYKYTVELDPE